MTPADLTTGGPKRNEIQRILYGSDGTLTPFHEYLKGQECYREVLLLGLIAQVYQSVILDPELLGVVNQLVYLERRWQLTQLESRLIEPLEPNLGEPDVSVGEELKTVLSGIEARVLPYLVDDLLKFYHASGSNVSEIKSKVLDLSAFQRDVQIDIGTAKELLRELEAYKEIRPYRDHDKYLDEREERHRQSNNVALFGIVIVILVWACWQFLGWMYGVGVQYSPIQESRGVVLDILYGVKVLSPTIIAVLVILVLLRWYSLERNALLMLQQRRSILLVTVNILMRLKGDDQAKLSLIQSLASSMLAFHSTGYMKRGLDEVSWVRLFGKQRTDSAED